MPKKKMIIPPATAAELIKKAGGVRVSERAAERLAEILIEIGLEISEEAVKLCSHAGRKTVKESDVELAKRVV